MKKVRVENVPYEKTIRVMKIFFSIATFTILLYLAVTQLVLPDERDKNPTGCQLFEVEWQRVLENGEKIPVQIPAKLDAQWGEVVTLTTTLPEDIVNGESLCFYAIWQDVRIWIDGELRLNYDTSETRPFGKNSITRYHFLQISEFDRDNHDRCRKKAYFGIPVCRDWCLWFAFYGTVGADTVLSTR